MSDWAFDLGNSRLKHALLGKAGVGPIVATAHDGIEFAPGWEQALPQGPGQAWLASVGPTLLRERLCDALQARGLRVHVATVDAVAGGIALGATDAPRLGIDRLLAMAAVHARDPGAALVVGVGTALTIDLLAAGGRHAGGRIAPSPSLMRAALHGRAPQLPANGGDFVEFAPSTASALASGCVGAALALVERSLAQASSVVRATPSLWLHGGGAAELLPLLPAANHVPTLVLEGLAAWAAGTGTAGR